MTKIITRIPYSEDNPHWRKPNYASDREVILAAREKRQKRLLAYTQTPKALARAAEMVREFDLPPWVPILFPETKPEIENEPQ